jgi:6-phosphogluconolactonase
MMTLFEKNSELRANHSAELILGEIERIAEQKKQVVVGLVGGRSVAEIYSALANKDSKDWSKVHFFVLDERVVPLNSEESNYLLLETSLFKSLKKQKKIAENQVHFLDFGKEDLNSKTVISNSISKYEEELLKLGKKIDIVILSSGEDNHIAAVYPNHSYPEKAGFSYMDDSPKPPSKRITATPKLIANAESCFIVFQGSSKKQALKHFLSGNFDDVLPIKTVKSIKKVTLITDLAAHE